MVRPPNRPKMCNVMAKVVTCLSAIPSTRDKNELARLVHNMGGSIRAELSPMTTHLVTNSNQTEKYRVRLLLLVM